MRGPGSISVIAVAMYIVVVALLAFGAEPRSTTPSAGALAADSPSASIEINPPLPKSYAGNKLDARTAVSLANPIDSLVHTGARP